MHIVGDRFFVQKAFYPLDLSRTTRFFTFFDARSGYPFYFEVYFALNYDPSGYPIDGSGFVTGTIREYFTRSAVGWLFEDYDSVMAGTASAGGASSIYRVATMLAYLRNDPGHDDANGAFSAAYGFLAASAQYGGPYGYLDLYWNQMDAYLFKSMWGYFYDDPVVP